MDGKKSNKISDIVRLQQILKKWRKMATAPKPSPSIANSTSSKNSNKSMKFLKKTLSFSESSMSLPKGSLAVCVGREMKRYVVPTEYLSHRAFGMLLREAEEEFGFQHEGALRIPCEVEVFERILKVVEDKKEVFFMQELGLNGDMDFNGCRLSEAEICNPHQPHKPMCR